MTKLPYRLQRNLELLGADLALARRKRRISLRRMAERMMVSVNTVQRMEKGDPGVGIGVIASALWVLGMERSLTTLMDPASDTIGMALDRDHLPKRIRQRKDDASNVPDLNF